MGRETSALNTDFILDVSIKLQGTQRQATITEEASDEEKTQRNHHTELWEPVESGLWSSHLPRPRSLGLWDQHGVPNNDLIICDSAVMAIPIPEPDNGAGVLQSRIQEMQ